VTREVPPEEHEDHEPEERPAGHVHPTSAGALVAFFLTGLVLGWLLRPVSIRLNDTAPTVGWLPVLALLFVAVIMGAVAWVTHRDLHRRGRRLEPHKAVNRLVLAKACALVGAMVGGGYFGYALSWWRVSEAALAQQRMVQSLVAGVAGVLIVAGSLLLERACRVRGGDETT
jgi:small-conductance mechanosensitive channel